MPEGIVNLFIFLFLISLLVLLVLSSFTAFEQEFIIEAAQTPLVYALKSVCLMIMLIHFFLCCFNRTYMDGQEKIFVRNIIKAYVRTYRFFVDLVGIIMVGFFIGFSRVH